MNTTPLSEELRRIADAAPSIPVDPDTWDRARAARRRDRSLVSVGVCVVAAAVVAAVLVLPGSSDRSAPPVADTGGALSGRIRNVDPTPLPDLRAGIAAAAYVTPMRHVVLWRGSQDGYRAIDIPERTGAIALSPDGKQLAYGYRYAESDPRAASGPRSGLGVLDLTTGQTRTVPISLRGQDIVVNTLIWGDLGNTVLYVGTTVDTGESTSGRLIVGAQRSTHLTNPAGNDVGVLVNGIVTVVGDGVVDAYDHVTAGARPSRSATVSSAGSLVGSCTSGFTLTTLRREADGRYSAQQYDDRRLDLAASSVAVPTGLGEDVSVLGCLTQEASTIVPPGTPSRLLVQNGLDLAVASLGDDASYDVVARVDPDLLRLTVATDLVE